MHVGLIIIFVSFLLFRISLIYQSKYFPCFFSFLSDDSEGAAENVFLGGERVVIQMFSCFLPGSRTSMERNSFRCGQHQFSVCEQFVWVNAECKANSHGRKIRQNAHAFHERPSFVSMWPKACSKMAFNSIVCDGILLGGKMSSSGPNHALHSELPAILVCGSLPRKQHVQH